MQVERNRDLGDGHSVEVGRSTWDDNDRSIRNRYSNANGGFNVRGSSEIPLGDLVELVKFAADCDELTEGGCTELIEHLAASIRRRQ